MALVRRTTRFGTPFIVAAALIATLLFPASFFAWSAATDHQQTIDEVEQLIDEVALVQTRSAIELAFAQEMNASTLRGVGAVGRLTVESAAAHRSTTVSTGRVTLEQLATRNHSTGREAASFLEALDDLELGDASPGDPWVLYSAAQLSRFANRSSEAAPSSVALRELTFAPIISQLILDEAVAADLLVNDRAVDNAAADYLEAGMRVVERDGGWLGPNSNTPLVDAVSFNLELARIEFPDAVESVSTIFVDSRIAAVDRWLAELSEALVQPPIPLAQIVERTATLTEKLSEVVERTAESERSDLAAIRSTSQQERSVLLAVSSGLAAIGALLFVLIALVVGRRLRHSHRQARLATIDRLTGIGNRHLLDQRTSALVADGRFTAHLVAIIDLDRFKMVNDVYGHGVGDQLLTEVAARLERFSVDWQARVSKAETSTIRLGGDEFLLTLHAAEMFDPLSTGRHLASLANQPMVLSDGTSQTIEFSVGIAYTQGTGNLEELMRSADLDLYENKSRRAHDRVADQPKAMLESRTPTHST